MTPSSRSATSATSAARPTRSCASTCSPRPTRRRTARVDRAWALVQQAAAAAKGNLAVVTHGLVCRSLAGRHLILPDRQEAPERWENTALTIIDYPAPWRVRLLNSIDHLDGLPRSESGAV